MQSVLLVIHLMIALGLVGVVLLQRSEGGALGIGGGGGGGGLGGLMSGRGAANALTRTTAILAAAFFATSIALSLIGGRSDSGSLLDRLDGTASGDAPLQIPSNVLDGLGGGAGGDAAPTAPASGEAPAGGTPAPTGPAVPLSQ